MEREDIKDNKDQNLNLIAATSNAVMKLVFKCVYAVYVKWG